jgi:putative hydrolase of the HAD superfamily
MLVRPLKYLARARAKGLEALLALLDRSGVRAGVLSDYPAEAKLRALGLGGMFAPILCSLDPDIDALKPDPKGFLKACEHWRLTPSEVLMVGDRADVDATGARAAGMACVILDRRAATGLNPAGYLTVSSFEQLNRALCDA